MSNLVKEKDYMWVVRAGQGAKYFEKFLSEKKIFLSWEGYKKDLKEYTSLKMMREEQEPFSFKRPGTFKAIQI